MAKARPIWLSHMHILVWLKEKLRTDPIDKIISVEIPDSNSDKALHETIIKNMIHGLCGLENPQCPCTNNGKYTKKCPP